MLNHSTKRKALERLERAQESHERAVEQVVERSVALHELRLAVYERTVVEAEAFVSALANAPKELADGVGELRVEYDQFDERLERLRTEDAKGTKVVGSATGAAVAAGVGVAAFGPSAAMALAMTFGTASTGTAISTLSGAAATNAALALLGGGAVAAGGGGMAAGNALLALAGPVGWSIGGVALAGAATWAHVRNKRIAEEATEAALDLERNALAHRRSNNEIGELESLTRRHDEGAAAHLAWLRSNAPSSYDHFDATHKQELAAFINNIRSLGELLGRSPTNA